MTATNLRHEGGGGRVAPFIFSALPEAKWAVFTDIGVWLCVLCCGREHYNPFVPWLKLLGGFFSVALSILWLLHIILYMLFTVRPYSRPSLCVACSACLTVWLVMLFLVVCAPAVRDDVP